MVAPPHSLSPKQERNSVPDKIINNTASTTGGTITTDCQPCVLHCHMLCLYLLSCVPHSPHREEGAAISCIAHSKMLSREECDLPKATELGAGRAES